MKIYVKFNDGFSLGKGNLFFCSLLLPHRSQQPAEPFCFTGARGIYDGHYRAHLIISTSMLLALTFLRFCYFYIPYIAYMVLSFMFILLLDPSAALLLQRRCPWLDAAKGERRNHYSRALLYPGEVASGVWSNIHVGLAATTPPNG